MKNNLKIDWKIGVKWKEKSLGVVSFTGSVHLVSHYLPPRAPEYHPVSQGSTSTVNRRLLTTKLASEKVETSHPLLQGKIIILRFYEVAVNSSASHCSRSGWKPTVSLAPALQPGLRCPKQILVHHLGSVKLENESQSHRHHLEKWEKNVVMHKSEEIGFEVWLWLFPIGSLDEP